MPFKNRVTLLFNIDYPLIQAGMVWCSGWKLASSVSNAGGLGLIGAGSMYPETLREHIRKAKLTTSKPFGVNLPLIYPEIEKHIDVIVSEGVRIVFTSAGNPSTWTQKLKTHGLIVVHVVSSAKFALKAEDAGVDAIVGEGVEAGGHNGREETTTFCLLPFLKEKIKVPIIGAGGMYSGRSMLAAFVLGAEGIQIGTRFAASIESSAHRNFKQKVIEAEEGDTELVLKKLTPVRLLKNDFYTSIKQLENACASEDSLRIALGKGRSKRGILEGDLSEGELEMGQIAAMVNRSQSAKEIVDEIWDEFTTLKAQIALGSF